MTKKKIFLVSNMFPSSKYPSYGIFVQNFVDQIKKSDLFCISQTVTLHKTQMKIWKMIKYLKFYIYIIFKGITCKYDILYVHFISHSAIPIYVLSSVKPRIKLILNAHGSDIINNGNFLHRINDLFLSKLYDKADLIVVPSNSFKIEIQKRTLKKNHKKIIHSYSSGIDRQLFKPSNDFHHSNNRLNIGFVSRIVEEKGWRVFFDSLKLLYVKNKYISFQAHIVGDGIDFSLAKKIIADGDLNNKVIFYGELQQSKLPDFLNRMDLFVFPSYRESLGLVGLEAMACGVPVIGSDIDGIKEYLKHKENGFLFEKGNPESLVEQILNFVWLNEDDKKKMSREASNTVIKFDSRTVSANLIQILDEL